MIGELGGEALVGEIVLGHDEQAACILVETVDDARPAHATDPGQAYAAMGDQPVHESAILVPRRGMHDESRRLVDDDEILVLMDDRQRQRLALGLGGTRHRNADIDPAPARDLARGVTHHRSVTLHKAIADQHLKPGA
ncbi:hypothetical protein GCM10025880_38090 [Methylorubrum aminovorans]|nr:hypothetical protein GCM10025880_38090 [Methylorubrum aminovorans]